MIITRVKPNKKKKIVIKDIDDFIKSDSPEESENKNKNKIF